MEPSQTRAQFITLTTDFGLQDAYVASLKGVIFSLAPEVRIIDISHAIPPQGIVEGGFTLACAFPHFPPGTIHILVVDPGVGSTRPLLLARTENHYFLAPDNGALGLVFETEPPRELFRITAARYFRPRVSATFQGRDILAPVAAQLARGTAASCFGDPVSEFVPSPLPAPTRLSDGRLRLEVITADRFGNLVLNLREPKYRELTGGSATQRFALEIGGRSLLRLLETYAQGSEGEPFALFNSSGYLEVAVRGGSAAAALRCAAGSAATLTLS